MMRNKSALKKYRLSTLLLTLFTLGTSCSHPQPNPYETAQEKNKKTFRHAPVPLHSGTKFYISQGAFGPFTHNKPGNEFNWDFDVPFGTQVVSIDDGVVLDIKEPGGVGGCNSHLCDTAHVIQIENKDGTVAQYVHIKSYVELGQHVKKGAVIGVTSNNGCICKPQLHFGVYHSDRELENSPDRRTVPLLFSGVADGLLKAKGTYVAP